MTFGDITTGASNDLKVASDTARRMVTQYGMSDKLGPVVFGEREEMVFLGKDLGHKQNYSEEVAREIDQEVHKLIDDAMKTAKEVLSHKKAKLEEIAKTLIEKETLEQQEFYAIVNS